MFVYPNMLSWIVFVEFFRVAFSTHQSLYLPVLHGLEMKSNRPVTDRALFFHSQNDLCLFNRYKKHSGMFVIPALRSPVKLASCAHVIWGFFALPLF